MLHANYWYCPYLQIKISERRLWTEMQIVITNNVFDFLMLAAKSWILKQQRKIFFPSL